MSSPRTFSPTLRRLLPAGFLCFGLLAGCAVNHKQRERDELNQALWEQRFDDGIQLANKLRADHPNDPLALELYDVAYLGYFLDAGRRATFANQDEQALEWFAKASAVEGNSRHVADWTAKTKHKLANRWLLRGNRLFTIQEYSDAAAAFRRALEYAPGLKDAVSGLEQVTRVTDYRNGLGTEYYNHGVRSLAEYQLRVARREFLATSKYLPKMKRAKTRSRTTDELLAQQRVQVARGFEAEGLYTAAHREFLSSIELDADNGEAIEGAARLAKESKALSLLRAARINIYRRRFDDALAELDKGLALTEAQGDAFEEAREAIHDLRMEEAYLAARVLEQDGKYPEAIKAFEKLAEDGHYYKDARARKTTLAGYVEMAAGYYKKAMEAQDSASELEHLRSIEAFWPDYRDIADRIERLATSE